MYIGDFSRLSATEWAEFNSSLFKYNSTPSTWHEAKAVCNANGGGLASIASEQENTFLYEKILKARCLDCYTPVKLFSNYALDGSDDNIIKHGAAEFQMVGGKQALYLNGEEGSYATFPSIGFRKTRFTVGIWIRPVYPFTKGAILADWWDPHQFKFLLDGNLKIDLLLRNTNANDFIVMASR
ncbi:predicted protein [Nematostella vectensis]|uniref:C-type lectin domain-containing protein n=1 Tax=Nematostella vectensis TaxID=45351 RepID=A7SH40_NEMVE|nr:predicted protein [Nematostella vectensis]|eukprot:XP_001629046.1 predicted protein [Nematostella vectensis]